MHDEPKPSIAITRTVSSTQALRRVADALGVPVSIFGGVGANAKSKEDLADPEEEAVLATVRSYLERANPAGRERFVAAVRTIVEVLPR